ncbi:MAG: MBL fold metallo-hydrolase, partial [Gemmatimonadota bacterium]
MVFHRFVDDGLAQFSYFVGSETAGEVVVVDPRRDVEPYLAYAWERGVRIAHVLETHIHADYASGAAELAHRTGARLHLSAYDRGERYEV